MLRIISELLESTTVLVSCVSKKFYECTEKIKICENKIITICNSENSILSTVGGEVKNAQNHKQIEELSLWFIEFFAERGGYTLFYCSSTATKCNLCFA